MGESGDLPPCDLPSYRGRFAPTPSGPLHFGSLIAALASCLEARAQNGLWFVRMEDADFPRNRPGAEAAILRALEAHGFRWDAEILRQSQRLDAYRAALEHLKAEGRLYPCACSRKEIAARNTPLAIDGGLVYPGFCRAGLPPGRPAHVWRMRIDESADISFTDGIQGETTQNLAHQVGDFILWRVEGLFTYQLTVVVDDAWQGITHIVRGADLIDSTARQIYLQTALAYPTPAYAHLPVATNPAGEKLSKQTRAAPLNARFAAANLTSALLFLGQRPPEDLTCASVQTVWEWASENWDMGRTPTVRAREAT
ncbi:MAG: tRNA glutamyl-Q(34) synthetase GluQRS [Zoogloeaceae bacterium]|jgi:glutamyl-Q tRNA(Asp) synthetase|nr:tRNA glutamyl-Q(34) synthetase GluQRS [Zoogloeaceae bacterium]